MITQRLVYLLQLDYLHISVRLRPYRGILTSQEIATSRIPFGKLEPIGAAMDIRPLISRRSTPPVASTRRWRTCGCPTSPSRGRGLASSPRRTGGDRRRPARAAPTRSSTGSPSTAARATAPSRCGPSGRTPVSATPRSTHPRCAGRSCSTRTPRAAARGAPTWCSARCATATPARSRTSRRDLSPRCPEHQCSMTRRRAHGCQGSTTRRKVGRARRSCRPGSCRPGAVGRGTVG